MNDAWIQQSLKSRGEATGDEAVGKLMDDKTYAEVYRQFTRLLDGKER
jgi:hypothetical protein